MQQTSHIQKIKSILPQTVEWINVCATLYLISTFILSFDYQRPALYIYTISTLADIIVNKRFKNIKWNSSKWTFIVMAIFYLCIWIWHIFEDCSSPIYFHSTDIRLPFLAFGIIGLFNINPKIRIRHIAYTMLATSVLSIIYVISKYPDVFLSSSLSISNIRQHLPIIRLNLFHVTHIEFNLYLNSTIAMCAIAFCEAKKKISRIIFSIAICSIYLFLLLSEGRVGFATANILFLIFLGIIINRYVPRLLFPSIIIGITIIIALFNGHQRLQIDEIENDPRNTIWELASKTIKEKPILGHGVCCGREQFVYHSTTDESLTPFWNYWMSLYPNYNKNRFHAHNAFLESTIEFGIIGLCLNILIFILPIILTKHYRQLYLSFFILIFSIQALFESFTFHYQVILFCWILYFLLNTKLRKQDD